MELILVRHGLPEHLENEDGQPADPPLSPTGRDQAERVGRWLSDENVDAIYASPLLRAQQTAAPLAQRRNLTVDIEPGITEMDADAAEYIPLEQLKREDYARWRELMEGGLYAGRDIPAFAQTVETALRGIADRHAGARVAVFCHGGVINAWASHVIGSRETLFFDPTYTSINRFAVARSGQRSVLSLNETPHLKRA